MGNVGRELTLPDMWYINYDKMDVFRFRELLMLTDNLEYYKFLTRISHYDKVTFVIIYYKERYHKKIKHESETLYVHFSSRNWNNKCSL